MPEPARHSPVSSTDSAILDLDTLATSTSATSPRLCSRPGTTVSNIRIDKKPLTSPAISGFTFNLDPESLSSSAPVLSPDVAAFSEATDINFSDPFSSGLAYAKPLPHAVSPPPTRVIQSMDSERSGIARTESASRRVNYFTSAFANGDGSKEDAVERVKRDSPIVAELRTNVIIKDEYTAITSLSQHLSERYRRPESAVLLTVTHSTCLMMGGSFEPAYILDIAAIPSDVQPTTNKRNAYLIQAFMADALHVPSDRGVVRFSAVEEEKLATNGTTVAGDIARAEKEAAAASAGGKEERNGLVRNLTSKSSRLSLLPERQKSVGPSVDHRKSIGASNDNRKSMVKSSAGERKSMAFGGEMMQSLERRFSTRSLRSTKSLKDSISPPIPTEFPVELLPSPTSMSGVSMAASPKTLHFPELPKPYRLSPLPGAGRSSPVSREQSTSPLPLPLPSPLSQNPPSPLTSNKPPQLPPLSDTSASPSNIKRARSPIPAIVKEPPLLSSIAMRPGSRSSVVPQSPSLSALKSNRKSIGPESLRPQSSRKSLSGTMSPPRQRPQSARKNLSNTTGLAGAIPSPPPIPEDGALEASTLKHRLSKRKSFVSLFSRKSDAAVRAS